MGMRCPAWLCVLILCLVAALLVFTDVITIETPGSTIQRFTDVLATSNWAEQDSQRSAAPTAPPRASAQSPGVEAAGAAPAPPAAPSTASPAAPPPTAHPTTRPATAADRGTEPPAAPAGVRLFVGVLTAAENRHRRDAVRQTWGSDNRLARVVFVVAWPISTRLQQEMQQEAAQQGDLVCLTHVQQHYHNLTHQTLQILKLAAAYNTTFVTHALKCDDDSYIHVDRLLTWLTSLPITLNHSSAYIGFMREHKPMRHNTSRWYAPPEVWPETQPKIYYATGAGYLLTVDLVREIANGPAIGIDCQPGPLYRYEDVAVATWVYCLQHVRNISIAYSNASSINPYTCAEGDLISHRQTAEQLRCIHAHKGHCCPRLASPAPLGAG